jgi:AcrR family transcriptional regulator
MGISLNGDVNQSVNTVTSNGYKVMMHHFRWDVNRFVAFCYAGGVPIPKKPTRTALRQIETRVRLRQTAYALMADRGVDGITIQEITDAANIGFGTFYNYYASKESLALDVLDCLIHNLGERNDLTTHELGETDPVRIVANSVRFVMRDMVSNTMWRFWLARLDLLVDRMRVGFGPFGLRDIAAAVASGQYELIDGDTDRSWSHLVWLMAAAGRDISDGRAKPSDERVYAEAILRVNGVKHDEAHAATLTVLPPSPALAIDFGFESTTRHQL